MIVDGIGNWKTYKGLSPRLDKAFEYLAATDFGALPEGKVEIDGSDVYALVQRYETIDATGKDFEAHRNYIDIQFIAKGRETLWCRGIAGLSETVPYNDAKDVLFFGRTESIGVNLEDGGFAVLFPQDAHLPKAMWDEPCAVTKVVVKVRV